MTVPILLAHGTLGSWDEMIFLGVVVIFISMLGVSWVRSRAIEPEFEDEEDFFTSETQPKDEADRFKLD